MSRAAAAHAARARDGFVVGIASSAGGVEALLVLVAALPSKLAAAILIVQHASATGGGRLPAILGRHCALPVRAAADGDGVVAGLVLVCPAGTHLLVRPGPRLGLSREAPVHFVRPSADMLFESLARTCGGNAIAVVLSGAGTDGAAGVRAVKSAGGTVVVEDRTTAQFYGMPGAAIRSGAADLVLPVQQIAAALVRLTVEACHEPN